MQLEQAERDRIKKHQNEDIIVKIGNRYGLTKEEALLMYAQYWHEYVLGSMARLDTPIIQVQHIAGFRIEPKRILGEITKEERKNINAGKIAKLKKFYLHAYETRFRSKSIKTFAKSRAERKRLTSDTTLLYITNFNLTYETAKKSAKQS